MLTAALPLSVAVLAAAVPKFTPADTAKLNSGEVLIRKLEPSGGEGVAVKAAAVIDGAPERVFEIVDRCAHFSKFMPRTKRSEERSRSPEKSVCFVEISMPFPLKNLWAETNVYRAKLADGALRRVWKLKEGTYHKNTGSWTVYPWGKGKSLAVYRIDTNPDIPIPDAITRSAQSSSLPDVFKAVRNRLTTK